MTVDDIETESKEELQLTNKPKITRPNRSLDYSTPRFRPTPLVQMSSAHYVHIHETMGFAHIYFCAYQEILRRGRKECDNGNHLDQVKDTCK